MAHGRDQDEGRERKVPGARHASRFPSKVASAGRGGLEQASGVAGKVASAGHSGLEQAGEAAGKVASAGRSGVQGAGQQIKSAAGEVASAVANAARAVSPKRLLKLAAVRAALAMARRHRAAIGAGVGTIVLAGAGIYFAGRRSGRK